MASTIPDAELDQMLALQFTIAWAGEGACVPPRLGWWKTDLIDPAGGGDLMARLLPKTHAWASLEAAREAALRADAAARAATADPDKLRTLFFLGFEVDEQLSERLAFHKRSGIPPADALPLPLRLGTELSPETLEATLQSSHGKVEHTVVPGGRQVRGRMPEEPTAMVRLLAAALLPLADKYPMPFYRLK